MCRDGYETARQKALYARRRRNATSHNKKKRQNLDENSREIRYALTGTTVTRTRTACEIAWKWSEFNITDWKDFLLFNHCGFSLLRANEWNMKDTWSESQPYGQILSKVNHKVRTKYGQDKMETVERHREAHPIVAQSKRILRIKP